MEKISTVSRTHPLIIAAALSVITVSAAGTAALFGLLPAHKADSAPLAVSSQQMIGSQQAFEAQQAGTQLALAPAAVPAAGLQRVRYDDAGAAPRQAARYEDEPRNDARYESRESREPREQAEERVAPRKPAAKPVHHASSHHKAPVHAAAPAQRSGPNYLAIGTGAVIGGVIGHQIGGGNGKKVATVAGIIGGGLIGNEIANRNK
ncbi:MAG: glycine zipper 2TM domain-containing protein [Gammaproteobacteria bacterium]